jgi:hypothetical protein
MSPRHVLGSCILLSFLYDVAKACTWFLYIIVFLYDVARTLACIWFLHIIVFFVCRQGMYLVSVYYCLFVRCHQNFSLYLVSAY